MPPLPRSRAISEQYFNVAGQPTTRGGQQLESQGSKHTRTHHLIKQRWYRSFAHWISQSFAFGIGLSRTDAMGCWDSHICFSRSGLAYLNSNGSNGSNSNSGSRSSSTGSEHQRATDAMDTGIQHHHHYNHHQKQARKYPSRQNQTTHKIFRFKDSSDRHTHSQKKLPTKYSPAANNYNDDNNNNNTPDNRRPTADSSPRPSFRPTLARPHPPGAERSPRKPSSCTDTRRRASGTGACSRATPSRSRDDPPRRETPRGTCTAGQPLRRRGGGIPCAPTSAFVTEGGGGRGAKVRGR